MHYPEQETGIRILGMDLIVYRCPEGYSFSWIDGHGESRRWGFTSGEYGHPIEVAIWFHWYVTEAVDMCLTYLDRVW